jgi:NAD(P)-dependent dehydrogenase (short-subunit alcohol dehydrogenase family)
MAERTEPVRARRGTLRPASASTPRRSPGSLLPARPDGTARQADLRLRALMGIAWRGTDPARLRAAIDGRLVLVTGASAGIGEAAARAGAAAGGEVLLVARSTDLLEKIRDDIVATGGVAHAYPTDMADLTAVEELLARVESTHGAVDVLVNNAGRSLRRSVADSADRMHDYTRTIDVNYLGPVRLALGLLPAMRRRGSGHIVNVSTVGVDVPAPRWSAYTASKAAFETWLRCVAPEIRADGITTSSIHFPLVHTAMSAPTRLFRQLPGMSPTEAGAVVCRAIAERPRLLSPWWSRTAGLLADAAQGPLEAGLALACRLDDRRVDRLGARR